MLSSLVLSPGTQHITYHSSLVQQVVTKQLVGKKLARGKEEYTNGDWDTERAEVRRRLARRRQGRIALREQQTKRGV
eukprot:6208860-Pleurochrysis_carterae.AAC.2